MKTLYIHIGTPKTGSSAIQAFLSQNREVLTQKGFCYPKFPFHYDYVSKNRNGYFLRAKKLENRQSDFEEGIEMLRKAFEEYSNVILSEEGIWYENFKWHQQLFDVMQEKGYQVKIIVYLRRQDDYVVSRWNQFVKSYSYKYKHRDTDDGIWENFSTCAVGK